jgi:D-ornithine 4,5-aminomutase subunit alpha
MERHDDFQKRRMHLQKHSDDELKTYFWELINKIVSPLAEEAKSHTTPSIERSVLLRIGFSSIEAKALVNSLVDKSLLGHGAGNIVYRVAKKRGLSARDAGLGLINGNFWEDIGA